MTMSQFPFPYWGNILKSNSNGTYFGLSIENVNRDERGYVDFEKVIGLDGIAFINIVGNPDEAVRTGQKALQTRITHNDGLCTVLVFFNNTESICAGGTWKPLMPPAVDSLGNKYECQTTTCALHVHGYTERSDPRATYSSPSIVGLIMAVGNVGEYLAPYDQSDTFLSRDAGVTWEEVHKHAHLWEFGDSGSILVMANDEEPTDHVLFSTDEGLKWHEYKFSEEKMRIRSIVTMPTYTSRKFILIGSHPHSPSSSVVHVDFTSLTSKQCAPSSSNCFPCADYLGVINLENPGQDDFELWNPGAEHQDACLFGRQVGYILFYFGGFFFFDPGLDSLSSSCARSQLCYWRSTPGRRTHCKELRVYEIGF
jgi:hypothetical protein